MSDNFEELRQVKPRRARAPGVAPVVVSIQADIAAVTLIEPAAFAPVELPPAAAPADIHPEEPSMATTPENYGSTITQTATDKAQAHFADINARASDAMEKGAKLFAEMNGFTKANVEALVESGKLAASGLQSLAQDQAAFVRKQFEEATAAARTMTAVKSPTEFVKLQGDYVRQQFDTLVQQGSRSTEAMLKLAGEVVQPVANRVAVAVERVKAAA